MLDPHLSALLWMGVFATMIIVIIMPQPLGIRALVIITILRLIFSVGLEPTLFLLGAFNVSILKGLFSNLAGVTQLLSDPLLTFCFAIPICLKQKCNCVKLKQ